MTTIRCYPTPKQKGILSYIFEKRAMIWNAALTMALHTKQVTIDQHYRHHKQDNHLYDMLTELKHQVMDWLANKGPKPKYMKDGSKVAMVITNYKIEQNGIELPMLGRLQIDQEHAVTFEDRLLLIRDSNGTFVLQA